MTTAWKYLDPKVLQRISRLELRARLIVEGFIAGLHRSPYRGFAVEFASYRPYVPGDEIRHVDWKLWARADRFYVKEHEEETNLPCTIVLDASGSMGYGQSGEGGGWGKFDYAATLTGCLAYLLHRQQDAVGLLAFSDRVALEFEPASSAGHLKNLLEKLGELRPERATAAAALGRLGLRIRRRGLVVLISDLFLQLEALAEVVRQLRYRGHEVIVFHVLHEDELTFPFERLTMFHDLEGDRRVLVDPRGLRRAYLEALKDFLRRVRTMCAELAVDYVQLSTAEPLEAALARYLTFRGRAIRGRRRR